MKPLLLLALAGSLAAQSYFPGGRPRRAEPNDYRRHNITLGAGGGLPRGELRTLFSQSPSLNVGYGYRFARNFQLDGGLETIFGAADVRSFLPTQFGNLRIRDFQFLVPVGGRAILPLGTERVLLFGGGGGAYLRYSERLQQPFSGTNFRIACQVCNARDGWAYYGLVGSNVFLDRNKNFRVGVSTRVYRGYTDGDPLGDVPRLRTRDHWVNVMGEVGFSF